MVNCEVNNIKASCKIKGEDTPRKLKELASHHNSVTKKKSNFFVLREKFVYVIFYTGHVNITGAKSRDAINEACSDLSVILNKLDLTLSRLIIDNICLSGSLPHTLNLVTFSNQLLQDCVNFSFNPRKFPGLSFPSTKQSSGTTIVFTSGKFIIVGLKHEEAIRDAKSQLLGFADRAK